MTDDRREHRESGWSLPPDQHDVPPSQRKIGEGAFTDGPNAQAATAARDVGPLISREPSRDEDLDPAS